ncbi:MAG: hypothetical protein U0411_03590 [Thermodesulfovibrionales bacterium]
MSLLADLLSKVKATGGKRDVPPDLREAVADFARRAALRRKVVVLSLAALLAVGSGFGAVYVLEHYVKPAGRQKEAARSGAAAPLPAASPAAVTAASATPSPAPVAPVPQPGGSAPPEPAAGAKTGNRTAAGESAPPRAPLPKRHKNTSGAPQRVVRKNKPEQQGEIGSPHEKAAPVAVPASTPIAAPGAAPAPARQQPSREELADKDTCLYAARTFEARKEYPQALAQYRKALELDPESYLVMNNIAGVLIQTGAYEESMHYSRRALAARQNYAPSLVNLGVASIRLNNLTEGEGYLSKALSIEPANRLALLNLALLQEKTKEYDKASRAFTRLAETGDLQGNLGMARIAEKRGQRREAVRFYREILSLNDLDTKTRKMINERLQALDDGAQ